MAEYVRCNPVLPRHCCEWIFRKYRVICGQWQSPTCISSPSIQHHHYIQPNHGGQTKYAYSFINYSNLTTKFRGNGGLCTVKPIVVQCPFAIALNFRFFFLLSIRAWCRALEASHQDCILVLSLSMILIPKFTNISGITKNPHLISIGTGVAQSENQKFLLDEKSVYEKKKNYLELVIWGSLVCSILICTGVSQHYFIGIEQPAASLSIGHFGDWCDQFLRALRGP